MALNYASKYAPMVDERFRVGALTSLAVNQNYDWAGVQTVRVYSIPTAPMQNYQRDGDKRYGNPDELGNHVQELPVKRDRSFTFSIDRGNYEDSMMVSNASNALRRQLDEVVIPEIDKYRLSAMACGASHFASTPITASNAYESLLDADVALTEANVPSFGRIAFVSPTFYKLIMLDNAFVKQGDLSQDMMINGAVGLVDNIRVIRVPSGYLPAGCDYILCHPDAVVAPQKLAEYKIHDNPPGINGWLVEGRVCYDAFVLRQKSDALYLHQNALGSFDLSCAAAGTGLCRVFAPGSGSLVYKTGAAVTLPSFQADVSTWTALPADGVIATTAGHKIAVASAIGGKAILAASCTAITG